LIVPWWAIANIIFAFIGIYWVIVPLLYYTNVSPPILNNERANPLADLGQRLHAYLGQRRV
jgi:hypothetical protein